jgi:hypothetical protein
MEEKHLKYRVIADLGRAMNNVFIMCNACLRFDETVSSTFFKYWGWGVGELNINYCAFN